MAVLARALFALSDVWPVSVTQSGSEVCKLSCEPDMIRKIKDAMFALFAFIVVIVLGFALLIVTGGKCDDDDDEMNPYR